MKTHLLEQSIERESGANNRVNPLGTLAGVAIGVLTTLGCGKGAYRLPGGALGAGVLFTMLPEGIRFKLSDYLINIANCEVGYYAGVILTDSVLNWMR